MSKIKITDRQIVDIHVTDWKIYLEIILINYPNLTNLT
jgi:hypothetical protein